MILVTGGLGTIGAQVASALVDLGEEVIVTSHRRLDVPSFLAGRVTVESLGVTDREAFLGLNERHKIGGIVHLAGKVPGEDPVDFVRTEMTGLINAMDAARTWGVGRFAVASSLETIQKHCWPGRAGVVADPITARNPVPPVLRS